LGPITSLPETYLDYDFGMFDLSGFNRLTISLFSNVTGTVSVYRWFTQGLGMATLVDSFSVEFTNDYSKTYTLDSGTYQVVIDLDWNFMIFAGFYAST
jgi:hypothetical protein